MKKIIYIDCCIRDKESRTRRIATPIIDSIKNDVELEVLNLFDIELKPLNKDLYGKRVKGEISEFDISWSTKIANCDGLIISAPFWDMSFPSQLKVFFEHISLFNILFATGEDKFVGLAKCPFMFYITSRGSHFEDGHPFEQATPYLKALCSLYNIPNFHCVSLSGTDFRSEEENDILISKIAEDGITLIKRLIK